MRNEPIAIGETYKLVRYGNRKLYSLDFNRYINLISADNEEVTVDKLLQAGAFIEVADHVTGVDITNKTISSIVNEKIKRTPTLGVALYEQLNARGNATERI